MEAADVMTHPIISVRPETLVADAIRLMVRHEVSGLPVLDRGGKLVGIVTEGDFLRRAELGTERKRRRWVEVLVGPSRLAEEYVQTHAGKVADVMTRDVVTVGPEVELDEIVAAMERHRIKRIPVVQDGRIVGIVSRANLLRAFGSMRPSGGITARSAAGDAAIRKRILAEIEAQSWTPGPSVSVVVWDGSVHFWGTITDAAQRRALRVLAENVPGVGEVRDHLVLVEPLPAFIS